MAKKVRMGPLEKLSNASYTKLFLLWMLLNIVCAVWYFELGALHSPSAPTHLAEMETWDRLFNSFYFSIITATSIGYGDIVPMGLSKAIAMVQAILALLIFAIFVAKLVTRRQDIIMDDMHRMTSESIFHSLRQGLFIVRKDFDTLIQRLETEKTLTPEEWDILATAYIQAEKLMKDMPQLYGSRIDAKRDTLLLEAIQRTLRRMKTLTDLLTKKKIAWKKHESASELKELISIVETVMPHWQQTHKTKSPIFKEIMSITKGLKASL